MSGVVGVDWARGCWVVATIDDTGAVEIGTEPTILNVWDQHESANPILVDIPIGLPETAPRACDTAAREFLGARRSSVFPAPCRAAVGARNYEDAREANGGTLGSQSWGLVPRIREVDVFLETHPTAEAAFYESHPEVCYAQFARRSDVSLGSKRDEQGIEARLQLLTDIDEDVGKQLRTFVDNHRGGASEWHHRIQSGRIDDVLDAAVLALTARVADGSFAVFPAEKDANEPCTIVYPPA
jgi:predicted RNase H-like nuclease